MTDNDSLALSQIDTRCNRTTGTHGGDAITPAPMIRDSWIIRGVERVAFVSGYTGAPLGDGEAFEQDE